MPRLAPTGGGWGPADGSQCWSGSGLTIGGGEGDGPQRTCRYCTMLEIILFRKVTLGNAVHNNK